MRKAARCYPANNVALMPNRFVAQYIGIACFNHKGNTAQFSACFLFFSSCITANKIVLREVNEPGHIGFKTAIDGAQLAVPSGEILFQSHRKQSAHTKVNNAVRFACFHNAIIEPALIFRPNPDFITKIASIGDTVYQGQNIGNIHLPVIHKFETSI